MIGTTMTYLPPKTKRSRRCVPLTPATTELSRDYLAEHPNADEPIAPLFPDMTLTVPRPTGVRAADDPIVLQAVAHRQAIALANLTVVEAEARPALDWTEPLRHMTFYKAVERPPVLRASRPVAPGAALSPKLKFHSLRHAYASVCGGRDSTTRDHSVDGLRQGHHRADRLHPPICGRPPDCHGCARRDGAIANRGGERDSVEGLGVGWRVNVVAKHAGNAWVMPTR
jgi:integrase